MFINSSSRIESEDMFLDLVDRSSFDPILVIEVVKFDENLLSGSHLMIIIVEDWLTPFFCFIGGLGLALSA